jgi:hypothetical protein
VRQAELAEAKAVALAADIPELAAELWDGGESSSSSGLRLVGGSHAAIPVRGDPRRAFTRRQVVGATGPSAPS